ncbi:MAG: hypothetical protein QOK14_1546, partial [Frankiaceae bacterium]|nr:hypothetical protein [Frankiaceae bacterium]
MTSIRVGGVSPYDVHVGRNVAATLPAVLAATAPEARSVLVVHPVSRPAADVGDALRDADLTVATVRVP